MRIVFGWNNFKIKSFTPFELGLSKTIDTDFSIEVRQSYFHFFWIPFFGIGKKWTIRKNGNLYELPAVYKDHVSQLHVPVKTPWYTYAGPLLIIAGFIIYSLNEKMDHLRYARIAKSNFEEKVAALNNHFVKTDNHDYYWLQEKNTPGDNKNVLLKVNEVKGNDIQFAVLTTGLSEYELSPLKIEYLFHIKGDGAEKVTVSKQKMAAAVNRNYGDADKGVDLFGDGRTFIAKDIYHLDGPLLVDGGSSGYSDHTISFDISNRGWPGKLTKITNLEGNFTWTNELPLQVSTASGRYDSKGQIALHGVANGNDQKYKLELIMLDSLEKEHKYIVQGEHFDRTITQLY